MCMYSTKLKYPPKGNRDEIRQNPLTNWRKTTFFNGMINVHNRGPKQLGQKEEREQVY